MARRKNTRFIDPRYFMDEKMERVDEWKSPSAQMADPEMKYEEKLAMLRKSQSSYSYSPEELKDLGQEYEKNCPSTEVNEELYEGEEEEPPLEEKKKKKKDDDWIQKAVNPKHKGYCTPMTKKTCTPPRKAMAKRFKKAAKKKEEKGGTGWQGKV